jgi:hypothetical protein
MITRMDTILFAALLASGMMAFESHQRIDAAVGIDEPVKTVEDVKTPAARTCRAVPKPAPERWEDVVFDIQPWPVNTMTVVCTPS